METDLTDVCWECGKRITADEAVVNWMSCSECFDDNVRQYNKKNWLKNFWFRIRSLFVKDQF